MLVGVKLGEVVVAAAAADAAHFWFVVERGFEDGAGVVVEAAGDRDVDFHAMLGNAGGAYGVPKFGEAIDAFEAAFAAADERAKLIEDCFVRSGDLHHIDDALGLIGGCAGGLADFCDDLLGADFRQLVESAEDIGRGRFAGRAIRASR